MVSYSISSCREVIFNSNNNVIKKLGNNKLDGETLPTTHFLLDFIFVNLRWVSRFHLHYKTLVLNLHLAFLKNLK